MCVRIIYADIESLVRNDDRIYAIHRGYPKFLSPIGGDSHQSIQLLHTKMGSAAVEIRRRRIGVATRWLRWHSAVTLMH